MSDLPVLDGLALCDVDVDGALPEVGAPVCPGAPAPALGEDEDGPPADACWPSLLAIDEGSTVGGSCASVAARCVWNSWSAWLKSVVVGIICTNGGVFASP